jgi:hypothetical protein
MSFINSNLQRQMQIKFMATNGDENLAFVYDSENYNNDNHNHANRKAEYEKDYYNKNRG